MRNLRGELKGSLFKRFLGDIKNYHSSLGKVRQALAQQASTETPRSLCASPASPRRGRLH